MTGSTALILTFSQREKELSARTFLFLSPAGRDAPAFAQLRLGEREAAVRVALSLRIGALIRR